MIYHVPLDKKDTLDGIDVRVTPRRIRGLSSSAINVMVFHKDGVDTANSNYGFTEDMEFLRTTDITTEQNYNIIEGRPNNIEP